MVKVKYDRRSHGHDGRHPDLNLQHDLEDRGNGRSHWTESLVISLPKKGNLQRCQNYRTISLISHSSKGTLKIILNRLQHKQKRSLQKSKLVSEREGAPHNHGEEAETQMVWPHLKIFCHGEDNSAGNSERSKRGKQKKRWEVNIKELTGMEFGDSMKAAENRERYCCKVICGAVTAVKVKGLG